MPVDLPLSMCWFSLCASYCSLLTYLSSGNLFVIFLWHCRQMYSSPKSDRYSVWEGELTLFSPRMCIYFQCTRSSLTNSIGCVFHACLFLCSYLQWELILLNKLLCFCQRKWKFLEVQEVQNFAWVRKDLLIIYNKANLNFLNARELDDYLWYWPLPHR